MPSFHLRNLVQVVECGHARSDQSTPSYSPGDARAMPPQPEAGSDSRIAHWAVASGRGGSPADFASCLDGRQVGAELLEIFRETPRVRAFSGDTHRAFSR